jgi:AraC-like DNA-binding protein
MEPGPSVTERELFKSDAVAIGCDRCRVDDPMFARPAVVRGFRVVFPCQSLWIRTRRARPYVSDPGIVEFYNDGDEFSRQPLDPRGDRTYWHQIDEADLREVLRPYDPAAAESSAPFRFTHGPTDAGAYLVQRALVRRLESASPPDALEVAETVFAVVDRVVRRAAQAEAARHPRTITRQEREIADRAAAVLNSLTPGRATLSKISRETGVSPFHLSRTFRKVTGRTLARHHLELRLLATVSALTDSSASLVDVAMAHGFSSHSHYSHLFRRLFGVTPSEFRRTPYQRH